MSERVTLKRRALRDELAFLLNSTVGLSPEDYDQDTLLMRLEAALLIESESLRARAGAVEAECIERCVAKLLDDLRATPEPECEEWRHGVRHAIAAIRAALQREQGA